MPSYEFIEYLSNEECLRAVQEGAVDMALVASCATDYYLNQFGFQGLYSSLINDFSWGLSFGVNKDTDPLLVSILNKSIASMGLNDSSQAVYLGMVGATQEKASLSTWITTNMAPLAAGLLTFFVVMFALVVLRQRKKGRMLKRQRDTDSLTGLSNRYAFERGVEDYVESSSKLAAFVILDLDDFKSINDARGHLAGDDVLKQIAGIISENFRPYDLCARLGGDEFIVFIAECHDPHTVSNRMQVLLDAIEAIPCPEREQGRLSASMGVAFYPFDGSTFKELYQHADQALYKVKQRGKAGFARYGA